MRNGLKERFGRNIIKGLGGLALILSGCNTGVGSRGSGGVVCNSPYIRQGSGCCLDRNSNMVCDNDEDNRNGGNTNIHNLSPGNYSGSYSCYTDVCVPDGNGLRCEEVDSYNQSQSFRINNSGIPNNNETGREYSTGDVWEVSEEGIGGFSSVVYVGRVRGDLAFEFPRNTLEINLALNGRSDEGNFSGEGYIIMSSCNEDDMGETCFDDGFDENDVFRLEYAELNFNTLEGIFVIENYCAGIFSRN